MKLSQNCRKWQDRESQGRTQVQSMNQYTQGQGLPLVPPVTLFSSLVFWRLEICRQMLKQLPSPGTLSTATVPPIASTHSLTRARPNPAPPALRMRELFVW